MAAARAPTALLNEIEECLRLKEIESVPNHIFANAVIDKCDGDMDKSFSDATVKFDTGRGVFLALFCHESIIRIMKKIAFNERCQDDDLINDLINFIMQDHHRQYIQKLKISENSEAEIQSVLAHHLFAPLVSSSSYKIDEKHRHMKKCFACKEDSILGDTSFGHIDVWHGYADILIEKSAVKVKITTDEMNEGNNPEGDTEESNQLRLDEDVSDVSECLTGSINEALPEVLAQTITNAFCEVKKNPHLSDYYIPSFLATTKTVTVVMYNCQRDRLFMSEDLPIFDESEKLNLCTILTIWFALNFDRLTRPVPDQEFAQRNIAVSNFPNAVGSTFSIYRDKLSKPLVDADKTRPIKRKYKIAPEMYWLETEYFKKIAQSFEHIDNLLKEQKSLVTSKN